MTPEQQRIAIAEACGYIVTDHYSFSPEEWKSWYESVIKIPIPDYLNDLNAMHEAEKVLDYTQRENYASNLYHVIPEYITPSYEGEMDWAGIFSLLHATAAQRAEAFLRTLNKWV